MNDIIQLLILGAAVQMQERFFYTKRFVSYRDVELLDMADMYICQMGLEPEDWADMIMVPSFVNGFGYIHISSSSLN